MSGPASLRVDATGGVGLAVVARDLDGPGVPVLLVHGLASNARLWDGVASDLAERGHPVAAADQRGHGRSDKPGDGFDMATLTADLIAVIDALGWAGRPVVAAGQSWGGNVVLELAARHPDSLAAAVLVDGGTIDLAGRFADWPTCAAALAPPPLAGTPAVDLERMLRARHADWPESGIAGTMANVEVLADGTIRPWLRRDDHMTILRGLWEHRPSTRYPDVAVPVLIVAAGDRTRRSGRFESAVRAEVAAATAGLPTSAVRWIDGDHDLHAQHPGLIADLVAGAADGSVFSTAGSG